MIPTDFIHPERLWALLAVPTLTIVYLVLSWSKASGKARARGSLELLVRRQAAWKRHVAVFASILSLASLVVAWAMPRGYVEVPRERATIVMVIDVSKSMEATDVKPTRLAAAQEGAKGFLKMLPAGFNVSLVAFAGTAQVLVLPTVDRGVVSRAIDNLKLQPSTAIGDGIYAGLGTLDAVPPDPKNPDEKPPAAMVLLSDGATNLGRKSETVAADAKKQGVPIFTIAYGTASGYVVDDKTGARNPVPVDHSELQRVADVSGGKKFSAASAEELKQVYDNIARSVGFEKVEQETTEKYVRFATLFGLLTALAAISLAARWP